MERQKREGLGIGTRTRALRNLGVLAGALMLGLVGCSSGTPAASSSAASLPTSAPASGSQSGPVTATSPAATPSSATGVGTLTLDENANNTTVRLGVGTKVQVDLHSTYWSPVTSGAPQLVEPSGTPDTAPPTPGVNCRPGNGCGTVVTTFVARRAGSTQLTATRSSCGEAMACPPDKRSFTVTIQVVNAG